MSCIITAQVRQCIGTYMCDRSKVSEHATTSIDACVMCFSRVAVLPVRVLHTQDQMVRNPVPTTGTGTSALRSLSRSCAKQREKNP